MAAETAVGLAKSSHLWHGFAVPKVLTAGSAPFVSDRANAQLYMDASLRSGSRLGRYELLVELGVGGMATVWIAREASEMGDRLVALKAMLPELARQPDFRTMFLEEGQIVRSIEHPHVVRVHEVGEDRGILFMAMEWVRGDSLRTIIREARRRRPIPPEMAVRIIADTAAGLHAAHELRGWDGELRNLVHCDVSPHNILVGTDGQARLVDFGVANGTAHGDPDGDEKVKGKFGYMSPEQVNAERIDRRSDVFALGIVLFELTTGERLFRGETQAHTLNLVRHARVPNPRQLLPDYPEGLVPIVHKALARDRNQRFQTADEMRLALEQFLVGERVAVSHAAVGKLVRKVLLPRLEQQDQALKQALLAADGMVRAGLLPEAGHYDSNSRVSRPSDSPLSNPFGSQGAFQHTLGGGSVHPQRAAPIGAVLFGALGVVAAVGAIIWTTLQTGPNALVSAPGVPGAAPGVPGTRSSGTATEGVSFDGLPVTEDLGQMRARLPGQHAAPRPRVRSAGDSAPDRRVAKEEKVELEESVVPVPSAEAPAVTLDDPEAPPPKPEPPAPPADERGPLNRGAALSALAAAGGRARACGDADGPSGSGRAMVTFSPEGPVSNVTVPAPFAGTSVGTCIATAFRSARVPAFTGSAVTLPASFRIQ
jgi:eukaryotic-like serine/threonine-protein kinase